MSDETFNLTMGIGLGLIIALSIFAFLNILQITPEDIDNCIKATNYTAERCEWEMTR